MTAPNYEFVLLNEIDVQIFKHLIEPELAEGGFFSTKRTFPVAVKVATVRSRNLELNEQPGMYCFGAPVIVGRADFASIHKKYGTQQFSIKRNEVFNLILEAGFKLSPQDITKSLHRMSKALRQLIVIDEEGNIKILDEVNIKSDSV